LIFKVEVPCIVYPDSTSILNYILCIIVLSGVE
jgi:hypothetical protein